MEPVDLLHRHEAAFVILGWCRERIANVFVDSPHLQSNLHAGGVVVLASMTSHCRDTLRREYVKYPVQQLQVGTCPFVAPYSARKVPQCIRL